MTETANLIDIGLPPSNAMDTSSTLLGEVQSRTIRLQQCLQPHFVPLASPASVSSGPHAQLQMTVRVGEGRRQKRRICRPPAWIFSLAVSGFPVEDRSLPWDVFPPLLRK